MGGVVLAISLNGFFLYLGALELVSMRPRTALTGAWYAAIGSAAVVAAVPHRHVFLRRLRNTTPALRAALVGLCVLATWFVINALLLGRSTLAYHFAGLFVLWTLPTAFLAFSLPPRLVFSGFRAIALLAAAFFVIDVVGLSARTEPSSDSAL